MKPVYPATPLQRFMGDSKPSTQESSVSIIKQAKDMYAQCGIERAAECCEYEGAALDVRMIAAVERGLEDIEDGRYVSSVDEAFARADVRRNAFS